jgi:hypothetical protein
MKHLITVPGAPTTTGKVGRFHKTLRRRVLDGTVFADFDEAQAATDTWVHHQQPRSFGPEDIDGELSTTFHAVVKAAHVCLRLLDAGDARFGWLMLLSSPGQRFGR